MKGASVLVEPGQERSRELALEEIGETIGLSDLIGRGEGGDGRYRYCDRVKKIAGNAKS